MLPTLLHVPQGGLSQGTNQQLKDGDADRIRRDSKGVADLIWQDLTLPADLWTAVGNVDEVVSKLRSQNKRADVPASLKTPDISAHHYRSAHHQNTSDISAHHYVSAHQ